MDKYVGVWIDHREAVVVWVGADGPRTERIASGVERKHRLAGGSRSPTPWGPQDVASDRQMGERRRQQLRKFLDRIIDRVRGAEGILVLGRGGAKLELGKRVCESRGLSAKLADVIGTDRMTDAQIVARVREFWGLSPQRGGRHLANRPGETPPNGGELRRDD